MLNLMALRYGDAGGEITLENFVVLALRMDCMASESLAYYVVLDIASTDLNYCMQFKS